jgi:hypothetical protein
MSKKIQGKSISIIIPGLFFSYLGSLFLLSSLFLSNSEFFLILRNY